MEENERIGRAIMRLNNCMRRRLDNVTLNMGVTRMQSMILGYLERNDDHAIYQRNIEAEFEIRRSSVTSILQLMERNGLIIRHSVENDGRLKQIVLTEKGKQINDAVHSSIMQTENIFDSALTERERINMLAYIKKLYDAVDFQEVKQDK